MIEPAVCLRRLVGLPAVRWSDGRFLGFGSVMFWGYGGLVAAGECRGGDAMMKYGGGGVVSLHAAQSQLGTATRGMPKLEATRHTTGMHLRIGFW